MKQFVFLFFLAVLTLPTLALANKVRLCYEDQDIYPWIKKEGGGLNIELINLVSQKSGIQFELQSLPWKRCLSMVEKGEIDGAFAASHKPDRAAYADYPSKDGKPNTDQRMMFDSYSLYKKVGSTVNWDGTKYSEIKSVGAQPGYSIVDQLKTAGLTIDESKTAEENFKKILADRISAAAIQTLEGDFNLEKSEFKGKIEKVATPLVEKAYYLIFSKAYTAKEMATAEKVWKAMAEVRESADYKAKEKALVSK